MDGNLLVTAIGALISIGIIYGTLRNEIKTLKTELQALRKQAEQYHGNSERLVAVETKLDILITQLINRHERNN